MCEKECPDSPTGRHEWYEVEDGEGDFSEPGFFRTWAEYYCNHCDKMSYTRPDDYVSPEDLRRIDDAEEELRYGRW